MKEDQVPKIKLSRFCRIYCTTISTRSNPRGTVYYEEFSAFLVLAILWFTVVYCPVTHWVWGSGGWLAKLGYFVFVLPVENAVRVRTGDEGDNAI